MTSICFQLNSSHAIYTSIYFEIVNASVLEKQQFYFIIYPTAF